MYRFHTQIGEFQFLKYDACFLKLMFNNYMGNKKLMYKTGLICGVIHTLYLTLLVGSAFYSVTFQSMCPIAYIVLVYDFPVFTIISFLNTSLSIPVLIFTMYILGFGIWYSLGIMIGLFLKNK